MAKYIYIMENMYIPFLYIYISLYDFNVAFSVLLNLTLNKRDMHSRYFDLQ